jgi:hypothetical protein
MANPRLLSDQAFAAAVGLPGPVAVLVKLCLEPPVHPAAALIKRVPFELEEDTTYEEGEATAYARGCEYPARSACYECHKHGNMDNWWGSTETVWDTRGNFSTDPYDDRLCSTCADKLAVNLGLVLDRSCTDLLGRPCTDWLEPASRRVVCMCVSSGTRKLWTRFSVRQTICHLRGWDVLGHEADEAFEPFTR